MLRIVNSSKNLVILVDVARKDRVMSGDVTKDISGWIINSFRPNCEFLAKSQSLINFSKFN